MDEVERVRRFAGEFVENAEAMQRVAEAMLLRNVALRRRDRELRLRLEAKRLKRSQVHPA